MKLTGLLDMIDGGGFGKSGDEFVGGPFSDLLNALGVRPHGYNDRMQSREQVRPQARPTVSTSGPAQTRPQARPDQPQPAPPNLDLMQQMELARQQRAMEALRMFGGIEQPTPGMPAAPQEPPMPAPFVGFDGSNSPIMQPDP